MTEKYEWQVVCDETEGDHTRCTSRLKIDEGWLYLFELLTPVSEETCQSSVALQFVPESKLRR